MNRTSITALLAGLLLPVAASAHRATEVYIPIGESPGVSGKYSTIGLVDEMEIDTGSLRMTGEGEQRSYTVRCDEHTHVYLDRSKLRKRSTEGTLEDVREGVRVEVKYADEEHTRAAWIKVEIVE